MNVLIKPVVPKVPYSVYLWLTMSVVSGENLLPFQSHIKFVEVEMDCAAICQAEIEILTLENRPPFSGVMYPLCHKSCMGFSLPNDTGQQHYIYYFKLFYILYSKFYYIAYSEFYYIFY